FRPHLFLLVVALVFCCALTGSGAVGGSISGTLKDASGAVIPGATLTLTNTALGSQFKTTTDARGLYSLPGLPVGRYDLTIEAAGFQTQKKTGLVIDTDSALEINSTLEVATVSSEVSVSAEEEFAQVHVETVATQLGEVVSDVKMTTLSLNGRSYTDLLPIQPGVTPITT